MQTIDAVILRLDEIISECKNEHSRIGYFAVLYRHVTIRIKQGIQNSEFEDNPRMEQLDVLFAKRFFQAYDTYRKGERISSCWLSALEAAKKDKHLVLQHLFLGINAHINLDLGIAAVETTRGYNLAAIQNDFNQINAILAELVDGVKENISKISPVFSWLIRLAKGKDEILLNFSIKLARNGAWKFANEYQTALNPEKCIHLRDQVITGLAEGLTHPGKRLGWVIFVINLAEWKSVPKVIDQLAEIVQKKT